MKASPEITTFHSFYLTSLTSIITSRVHQTSTLEVKHQKLYSEFTSSGKKTRSSIVDLDTTVKPIRGTHSTESSLAGDGSHSTDQPIGKVLGQAKSAIISSKDTPENIATSKAKYTNTQQGLLD
jgi:hypothetical protein